MFLKGLRLGWDLLCLILGNDWLNFFIYSDISSENDSKLYLKKIVVHLERNSFPVEVIIENFQVQKDYLK